MARQRARQSAWGDDGPRREWFTVETADGNAVGGVDGVFDFDSEEEALRVVQNLVVEVGKSLTVVRYVRAHMGTYQAVTKIEKVEEVSTG